MMLTALRIASIAIVAIVLVLSPLTMNNSDCASREDDRYADLQKLSSKNINELQQLCNNYEIDRNQLQGILINQFSPESSTEVKFTIASIFGYYRMEGSVRTLAPYIALENNLNIDNTDRLPLWNRYPVASALIKIGQPSIRFMIENIKTSDDQKVRELSAAVINSIEGYDVSNFILQKAMDSATDAIAKERFKTSIDYISKFKK
ncbi:MAG: hypothetical protein ACYC6A_06015 [Armatimonadota bacterium]